MDVCIVQHADVYSTCALESCINGVLNTGTWLANSGCVMNTQVVACMLLIGIEKYMYRPQRCYATALDRP